VPEGKILGSGLEENTLPVAGGQLHISRLTIILGLVVKHSATAVHHQASQAQLLHSRRPNCRDDGDVRGRLLLSSSNRHEAPAGILDLRSHPPANLSSMWHAHPLLRRSLLQILARLWSYRQQQIASLARLSDKIGFGQVWLWDFTHYANPQKVNE
jgi:hypothetical protein